MCPWPASQRRLAFSARPAVETSRLPSGLKASASTGPACPRHTPSGAPVWASHSRTLPSTPPEASRRPSGLKATAVDGFALLSPGHGDLAAGRRLPQAQRVVLGDGGQPAAVGAEGHAADRALVPRQDPGRLVELAVEVAPFPLAKRLGRHLEDPPGGRAVVQLQGRRPPPPGSPGTTPGGPCPAGPGHSAIARRCPRAPGPRPRGRPPSGTPRSGRRRAHFQARPQAPTGLATIGRPDRNRPRSSARASAVA